MNSRIGKHVFGVGVLFALVSVAVGSRAEGKGSFSGVVLLDGSQPLEGANVSYNNIPELIPAPGGGYRYAEPLITGSVRAGPGGTFLVSDTPAGKYVLCAGGTQPNHLRSCTWGQGSTYLEVPANGTATPATLNIRTGALVTFNVNDPSGLIRLNDTGGFPARARETNLGISMVAPPFGDFPTAYYGARFVSTTGTRWTYQVAVRIGVPLQLFFSTIAPMTILDQSGQPLTINKPTSSLQATDATGVTVNLSVQPSAQPVTGAVTNGATFQPGVAPGSIATVFDQGIVNVTGIFEAKTLPLPTEINGTSVSINGARVPLYAVSRVNGQEQVNFQVPSGLTAPGISVVVNNNGSERPLISSNVFPALPGIFTVDGRRGAIQHGSDFRLVTTTDPAIRGEPVVIYATGLGPANPDPGPGNPASASPLSLTAYPVLATVGGMPAPVFFSGLAPGFVGLNQVNIQIPPESPFGDVDVVLSVVIENITFSSLPVKLSVQ